MSIRHLAMLVEFIEGFFLLTLKTTLVHGLLLPAPNTGLYPGRQLKGMSSVNSSSFAGGAWPSSGGGNASSSIFLTHSGT